MQTLSEIRQILDGAHLRPRKRFGQNFLIDKNLMAKVVELAAPSGDQTVLEVGPGTGSLTEELLERAARVVAVEVDRGLARVLADRMGDRAGFCLIVGDVLAGKHELSRKVTAACGERAALVSNLPYKIATPLVSLCLQSSWRAAAGAGGCRFERLTFTVQKELAERLTASPGSAAYGPVSVLVALLGESQLGPALPAEAFWPSPKVASRAVRIDVRADLTNRVGDFDILAKVLATAFGQRRKQIGSIFRKKTSGKDDRLWRGLEAAGIAPSLRAEQIPPRQFAAWANEVAG